jgi:hypothetical protein
VSSIGSTWSGEKINGAHDTGWSVHGLQACAPFPAWPLPQCQNNSNYLIVRIAVIPAHFHPVVPL